MKVFLSWSGARSHAVAEALKDWLPDVINAVEPWLSSDIEKGAASMQEIATSLQGCTFRIICVTPENQSTPWINYEAGAISKTVADAQVRVATLLIDIERPAQVTGPLAQFQATKLELDDFIKLVLSLDTATGSPREQARVEKLVRQLWPSLEERLNEAKAITAPDHPADKRSADDKLDELLELTRTLARSDFANLPTTIVMNAAELQDVLRMTAQYGSPHRGQIIRMTDDVAYRDAVYRVTDRLVGKKETRGLTIELNGEKPIIGIPAPVSDELVEQIIDEVHKLTGIRPDVYVTKPRAADQA